MSAESSDQTGPAEYITIVPDPYKLGFVAGAAGYALSKPEGYTDAEARDYRRGYFEGQASTTKFEEA